VDKRKSSEETSTKRVCYTCGKSGQICRFCPQRESSSGGGRVDTVSSCQVVHEANRFCCQHESDGDGTLNSNVVLYYRLLLV